MTLTELRAKLIAALNVKNLEMDGNVKSQVPLRAILEDDPVHEESQKQLTELVKQQHILYGYLTALEDIIKLIQALTD